MAGGDDDRWSRRRRCASSGEARRVAVVVIHRRLTPRGCAAELRVGTREVFMRKSACGGERVAVFVCLSLSLPRSLCLSLFSLKPPSTEKTPPQSGGHLKRHDHNPAAAGLWWWLCVVRLIVVVSLWQCLSDWQGGGVIFLSLPHAGVPRAGRGCAGCGAGGRAGRRARASSA